MKSLSNAVIINGVSYTINATEAKKVAELLGLTPNTTTSTPKPKATPKAEPKKAEPNTKKSTLIVGSLEQSGVYVRTIKGAFINSKARYAIGMSATNPKTYGAKKLHKGNKIYDSYTNPKDEERYDKYIQIYQFKSVEDAEKFMAEQQSRMAK